MLEWHGDLGENGSGAVYQDIRQVVRDIKHLVTQSKELIQAVRDGRAYVEKFHPNEKGLLSELLEQMRATFAGLISVSRLVTDFDFTIDGSDRDRQPSRFSEYLVQARTDLESLESNLTILKASCTRVHLLGQALQMRADKESWWYLFGDAIGDQAGRLAPQFDALFGVDATMITNLTNAMIASREALDDVRDALRDGAGLSVDNVSRAAAVLHERAAEYRPVEWELKQLRDELSGLIATLG